MTNFWYLRIYENGCAQQNNSRLFSAIFHADVVYHAIDSTWQRGEFPQRGFSRGLFLRLRWKFHVLLLLDVTGKFRGEFSILLAGTQWFYGNQTDGFSGHPLVICRACAEKPRAQLPGFFFIDCASGSHSHHRSPAFIDLHTLIPHAFSALFKSEFRVIIHPWKPLSHAWNVRIACAVLDRQSYRFYMGQTWLLVEMVALKCNSSWKVDWRECLCYVQASFFVNIDLS